MVRRESISFREHMRDGKGTVEVHDILTKEDLAGHGRLYAKLIIPPGASIGWHEHHGETEPYYILKGEGDFIDSDRSVIRVKAGDVCLIREGTGHSIENNSDADLEIMALIYNVEAGQ